MKQPINVYAIQDLLVMNMNIKKLEFHEIYLGKRCDTSFDICNTHPCK
jgi:hypothetical protein